MLEHTGNTTLKVATLILPTVVDCKHFILFKWVDENMLNLFVYISEKDKPDTFELISPGGIVSCLWELGIIWHEHNALIEYILNKQPHPDLNGYLNCQLNGKI
ncbi:MAG: hypothetical protein IPO27_08735 [Bacteroidetes bacterium]|nr:hypothetical protein [Bacteroidota bacterium]